MNSKRLDWLDSYRGILISMVILGHMYPMLPFFEIIKEMFLSMRMPAFFYISGYLFSKKYTDFTYFFKRRFRSIVIPYFIFLFLTFLFWDTIFFIFNKDIMISNQILAMFYGISSGDMLTASSLWFVLALFITEIYFFFIKNYTNNDIVVLMILILLVFIGYAVNTNLDFRIPWGADVALFAVGFYGLGYLTKKYDLINKILRADILSGIPKIIIIILLVVCSIYFSFSKAIFENYLYMYLGAFSGIIALIFISEINMIKKNNILQYLGKNTYIILAFHKIPIIIISVLFFKILKVEIPTDFFLQVILGVSYFLLVLVLLLVIIEVFNRFLPFILSKPKNV